MIANMKNIVLECIGVLMLVARADVSQLRRVTSEGNEDTYGIWRQIQREFTLEQLIGIFDKQLLKVNAIFESGLSFSKAHAKGYLKTFPDYANSLKTASAKQPPSGPVEVDLEDVAVTQVWAEVQRVIVTVNRIMKPFLKLFGVEGGNGLSPFVTGEYLQPSDLLAEMKQFLRLLGTPRWNLMMDWGSLLMTLKSLTIFSMGKLTTTQNSHRFLRKILSLALLKPLLQKMRVI